MNRKSLIAAAIVTALALVALLAYSLERTAWLFGLFEKSQHLAIAAAIVVELAAVALLAGAGALAGLDDRARAWANRALLAVLSVQALANLSAGYLRGGHRTLWEFGGSWPAYAVAASLWLVTNLAVPGLVLCLSKLLERLLAQIGQAAAAVTEETPQPDTATVAVPADRLAAYITILDVFDRNPRATTDDLTRATASSRRTVESRRSELIKLGAIHRTPDGYARNGVELRASE